MRALFGWLVFALLLLAPGLALAGPLKDIEDSGSSKPTRSSSRDRGHHLSLTDEDDEDDEDDDDFDSKLGMLVVYVLLTPWTIPNQLLDEPCLARYALRPYADGRGSLRNNEARAGCGATSPAPGPTRTVAGQLALEGGYALAFSNITAATVYARLQLPYRMELSGRLSVLTDLDERPREQALMGTAHISARFAQSARVEMRSGVGVRGFGLDKPLAGFDFLYTIDVYGKRPVIANLELHGGFLGHAGVVQARLTVGYLLRNLEVYVGYDHTRVNGSAGTTRLSGPLLGVRAYF